MTEAAPVSAGTATVTRSRTVIVSCAPVSACERPSRADAAIAASRSCWRRRAFSNATAACDARTSRTRMSSSSNWSTPRLDRTMTPVTFSPTFSGTHRIDSSISDVPSIWTPRGSFRASGA